jgi:chemotaxis protein histidine kinase CheA
MTAPTPVGYLDFFVLEAADYVEQLDALLLSHDAAGPDSDAIQRVGRALRGSATMAKLSSFAEVAAGIERVGRALREGSLLWNDALRGVLVAAIDDCKVLLRGVRAWNEGEERRARARIDELTRYAPLRGPTPLASPSLQGHDVYLATEAANIGAGLELLATRPADRDAATNVLRRVRALRGIASVKDYAALADILDAAEQAARPLELGTATLGAESVALLASAATVLRGIASAIRAGTPAAAASPDLATFAAAVNAMQERETGGERIVPIAELFFDDGGPTIVDKASAPPTTPADRFRLEAVSQGEHLRRLVADARAAHDDLARDRVRRGLRQALRGLREAAESYGERDVADFVASHVDAAVHLDGQALDSLDEVAALLAQPGAPGSSIGERIRALETVRASRLTPIASSIAVAPSAFEPAATHAERVQPAVAALAAEVSRVAPASASRADLLNASITNLASLEHAPLSAPRELAEQPPVPIDILLYRGRAAIERCVEIRDGLRRSGSSPDAAALDELFALLDLALTS